MSDEPLKEIEFILGDSQNPYAIRAREIAGHMREKGQDYRGLRMVLCELEICAYPDETMGHAHFAAKHYLKKLWGVD